MEDGQLEVLVELVRRAGIVVLSGAGLSTESGIPDYRGPGSSGRTITPMTYQVFTNDPGARRRYWARSHVGWRVIARAEPNDGHRAVAALQRQGLLDGIITQNVDGLHQAGGAHDVIELHGNLDAVVCLRCGDVSDRGDLAARLTAANPGWDVQVGALKPDGDADLPEQALSSFETVDCLVCDGVLKPDVVFFGETVPPDRVAASFRLVDAARGLLVLGSSLTVMSGYRFVLRAAKLGIPVAIANQGPTRGDARALVKVEQPLGELLTGLVATSPVSQS